jgi:uncharacterized protein
MTLEPLSPEPLPLLDLFTRLREAGLPLGISEYQAALQALQKGFGTDSREALAELCRMLWVKSVDDDHIFNYHFERSISKSQLPSSSEQTTSRKPVLTPEESIAPSSSIETSPTQDTGSASGSASSELLEVKEEIRVAKAVQFDTKPMEMQADRFAKSDEYFPVTRRQMKQSWRYLRRMVREGASTELDVGATIEQITQQGILVEPVLVPGRVNRTELVMLIDQRGSMVPFHALSERLVETALGGGRLGKMDVYYFHNCPTRHVYRDPGRRKAVAVKDLLGQLRPQSLVLIFSDIGAARGSFSGERLALTRQFLADLRQKVRYVAWLNPMAQERWLGTTAGEVADDVPMFEMSRRGLDAAISVLQGRGNPIR